MKIDKNRFREWLVEFRFTLMRGYGWLQVPLLGFVAIWVAGVVDKKYRFLHEEMNYSMRVNPLLMKVIDNVPNQSNQPNQEIK